MKLLMKMKTVREETKLDLKRKKGILQMPFGKERKQKGISDVK